MLDAHHMNMETDYGSHKRWMLNRLVLGSGVVIGLDVEHVDELHGGGGKLSIAVTPGAAIDWRGREIIVPKKCLPVELPVAVLEKAKAHQQGDTQHPSKTPPRTLGGGKHAAHTPAEHVWVQVRIRYQQTEGDPVDAEAELDCGGEICTPGAVFEGYKIEFYEVRAPRVACGCPAPVKKRWGDVDYRDLVHWVTRHRPAHELEPQKPSAIVLANVGVDVTGTDKTKWEICAGEIEIEVRPIVFYNDMLYELLAILNDKLGQY
jgi:hypothetical protein